MQFFFYFFSYTLIVSALFVSISPNAITSILALILTFLNAAILFLISGAEFLALVIVVVYVGAIAVLFLFVIMMMHSRLTQISEHTLTYFPFAILLGIFFSLEISSIFFYPSLASNSSKYVNWLDNLNYKENIYAIGQILYTLFTPLFILCGLILLVAMLGAIVLVLHNVKINNVIHSQKLFEQINTPFIKNNVLLVFKIYYEH
jgi:NADH-quinone oxidoreductase subunit J